ncbi:WD40 repeat domain-containing protein [Nostoc sp.]|uniref:WD40 repeat domain-containing protein n=1 Tax=Nostoc sp. TaxID=1180 RepID=UPI002FFB7AA6
MGEFVDKFAAESPAFQRAYLGSLAPSLVKSGKLEKYYQILTDFDFLVAKINHPEFGVQPLIEDYDLIDDTDTLNYPEYNSEKVKSLKLIQGALKLSAHILAVDKGQLASQLHGRLLNQKMAKEIQALLAKIKQSTTIPWLCPLTPSLTPPGGGLHRTLNGHSNWVKAVAVTLNGHSNSVNAVAVTPNGQQVISASHDYTLKVWNLATGKVIATFTGEFPISCCAVAPDGMTIVAGEQSGRVHFLRLENMIEG